MSDIKKKFYEALQYSDDQSRQSRVERLAWAASINQLPILFGGEIVPLTLAQETQACFVQGNYLTSIISATAVVEHLLVSYLIFIEETPKRSLGKTIDSISGKHEISDDIIKRLKKLVEIRNPISHHREVNDETTLSGKIRIQRRHPYAIMEEDARFALEIMYDFFRLFFVITAKKNIKQIDEQK